MQLTYILERRQFEACNKNTQLDLYIQTANKNDENAIWWEIFGVQSD